jgi:hypothetical protein
VRQGAQETGCSFLLRGEGKELRRGGTELQGLFCVVGLGFCGTFGTAFGLCVGNDGLRKWEREVFSPLNFWKRLHAFVVFLGLLFLDVLNLFSFFFPPRFLR